MAIRYLRARRQEGFISVIALFSFLGIGLGVATLIIVMSVTNGFRADLLDRILGMNGHYEIKATAQHQKQAVQKALTRAGEFCYPFSVTRRSVRFQGVMKEETQETISSLTIKQQPLDPSEDYVARLTIRCK